MGDAEVAHLDLAVGRQQDILGLDVAVNHAMRVRHVEGLAELLDDGHHGCQRQRRVSIDQTLERTTLDIFHHQITQPIIVAHVVDGHDVGMLEHAGQVRLLLEAAYDIRAAEQVAVQHLDRDLTAQARVMGAIDTGHAAVADNVEQPVAAA